MSEITKNKLANNESMRGFDSVIYVFCGALLGSTAVGSLSIFNIIADTDTTRITGIAIGAIIVAVLRIKKVF